MTQRSSSDKGPKRNPGRPPREMPPRIDATPDEIAEVILTTTPPKEWQYLKRAKDPDEPS